MASRFVPEGQELTYKPDGTVVLTGSPTISVSQGTAENGPHSTVGNTHMTMESTAH